MRRLLHREFQRSSSESSRSQMVRCQGEFRGRFATADWERGVMGNGRLSGATLIIMKDNPLIFTKTYILLLKV
jgi:hypothetical protein